MLGDALLGSIAGAALATLPGGANWIWAVVGMIAGAIVGWPRGPWSWRSLAGQWPRLALLAFFVPALRMAVAPGADMAMHTALGRGLLEGGLSPAWPGVAVHVYPRGFSALIALFSPIGLAKASLVAAGASYAVFHLGLSTLVPWPLALVAVFLSRTPQTFFDWGGNPTALALGLGFAAAGAVRQGRAAHAALLLAGAAAVHPMAACAAALVAVVFSVHGKRCAVACAAALGALAFVFAALALFGPALSPRETAWIRDYARMTEAIPLRSTFAVLGDPAAVLCGISALVLVWKRQFRKLRMVGLGVVACAVLFTLLPFAGLYPIRFAPLLLLCLVPWWSALPKPALWAALAVAAPFHFRWYQQASPIATEADVQAIACVTRTVPQAAVIDGAYGDATQWIPALTGHPVTHPHVHVSLFDEADASLAKLPPATFRFAGDRLRYPSPRLPLPQGATALCDGHLAPL
jgi:hypothetical protein